ncbi:hypothetical protein D3C85_200450 [compost metagenome]
MTSAPLATVLPFSSASLPAVRTMSVSLETVPAASSLPPARTSSFPPACSSLALPSVMSPPLLATSASLSASTVPSTVRSFCTCNRADCPATSVPASVAASASTSIAPSACRREPARAVNMPPTFAVSAPVARFCPATVMLEAASRTISARDDIVPAAISDAPARASKAPPAKAWLSDDSVRSCPAINRNGPLADAAVPVMAKVPPAWIDAPRSPRTAPAIVASPSASTRALSDDSNCADAPTRTSFFATRSSEPSTPTLPSTTASRSARNCALPLDTSTPLTARSRPDRAWTSCPCNWLLAPSSRSLPLFKSSVPP